MSVAEADYRELVEAHEPELRAHCYRMLGSVHDAEDATQEALLRAWRGIEGFDGRSSMRTWLYRIATNTSLDAIAKRKKRVLPVDAVPASDPHAPAQPLLETAWVEPYPDALLGLAPEPPTPETRYERLEGVELAFIAALQHLPATQRAVLILREVLGFSAKEVAELLDTSVPAVNSALQRARKAIDERMPEQSQQETLSALGDDETRTLVERYVAAWDRGDVDGIVALLTDDASLTMPPVTTWVRGREDVAAFCRAFPLRGDLHWRHVPTAANGQPALGCYVREGETGPFTPFALIVLSVRGDRVAAIDSFVVRAFDPENPDGLRDWAAAPIAEPTFEHFGLPDQVADR